MTAFKNMPPWEDFQKGQDLDMLRMRKQFQNEAEENDAYEVWWERREREFKRRKVESQQHRMPA